MQEEKKIESMPLKKKRTGRYVLLALIALFLFSLTRNYYIRWGVHGRVIDKETGRPIPYALVRFRTSYGNDMATTKDITTAVADAKGNYEFPTRISESKSFTWSKPGFYGWTGQEVQVWFPGYKKFVAYTMGKNVFKGKMDIALERPKSAEEAVEMCYGSSCYENGFFEQLKTNRKSYCVFCNGWELGRIKCLSEIIKKNVKTEIGDKVFKQNTEIAKYINCKDILNADYGKKCFDLQGMEIFTANEEGCLHYSKEYIAKVKEWRLWEN